MHELRFRWRFVFSSAFHSTGNLTGIGVDKVLARDVRGNPIVPATTVKGVLRHWAEVVLRGWGEPVCAAPDPSDMCLPPSLCRVCQVFGNPRHPSPLRFTDGRPRPEERGGAIPHPRSHVALSRRRRSALEGRLFTVETLWAAGVEWEAEAVGRFPDPDRAIQAAALLALAALLTPALGSSRTRGLGWLMNRAVEIRLDDQVLSLKELEEAHWKRWQGGAHGRVAAPEAQEPAADRPPEG
ncbi:RAMP superfamily CRISPR-associated protein [Thermoflexus hugenholtzii]